MKLLLASLAVVGCAGSILSKSRAANEVDAPRKLSLFVRTSGHGSKAGNCGGQFPCDMSSIFASQAAPAVLPAAPPQPSVYALPQQQPQGLMSGDDCHPKCWWTCGNADCDETCDPVCAPPQCETACAAINLATCRQKCDPPKCAIVCPTQHCEHGGCPACKTVCAPPKCTTQCSEQCESKCSEPQCTWKCNPGKCEKPRCSLKCGGAKACGLDGNLNARPPPFSTGMTVLSKGLAATDPKVLKEFAAKGTPPGAKKMPSNGGSAPAPAASGPIR